MRAYTESAPTLVHGGDFDAPWYSAHDLRGRTIAAAQTLDQCRVTAPNADSYRERTDRGEGDTWAPAQAVDMFPDHAGGTLF